MLLVPAGRVDDRVRRFLFLFLFLFLFGAICTRARTYRVIEHPHSLWRESLKSGYFF